MPFLFICNASHWWECPYKHLPSVCSDKSGCGLDSVTLWEVDKTGLKKWTSKRVCSFLNPLAAPEVMSIEKNCFVLSSIGMRNLFTTNVQGIFFLCRNDYSFVTCSSGPLSLLKKDIRERVEVAIFQISFDSPSLIFRASFNRAIAK